MKKNAVDSTSQAILKGYFGKFGDDLTKKIYSKTKSFLSKKANTDDVEVQKINLLPLHHSENKSNLIAEFALHASANDSSNDLVSCSKLVSVKIDKVNNKVAFDSFDLD